MKTVFRNAMLVAIALAISGLTWGQGVFKCGSTYADKPCGDNAAQMKIFPSSTSGNTDEETLQKLKSRVLRKLKDPDSAQFKELRVVGAGAALCGLINAKNSYGGYTRYKRIVADNEGAYFAGDGSTSADRYAVSASRMFYPKATRYGCSTNF